jgi:hypothetical protein
MLYGYCCVGGKEKLKVLTSELAVRVVGKGHDSFKLQHSPSPKQRPYEL